MKYILIDTYKKNKLVDSFQLEVHNNLLFSNTTEAINNNSNTKDIVLEIIYKQIMNIGYKNFNNIMLSFVKNDNFVICSYFIDKINLKKGTYRLGIKDWNNTVIAEFIEQENNKEE